MKQIEYSHIGHVTCEKPFMISRNNILSFMNQSFVRRSGFTPLQTHKHTYRDMHTRMPAHPNDDNNNGNTSSDI